jgi:hypothetical protein
VVDASALAEVKKRPNMALKLTAPAPAMERRSLAPVLGIPMKVLLSSVWVAVALIAAPAVASADEASVPTACRAAIGTWRDWRLSPPPRDYAAYAKQQRIEPNLARADFDDDGTPDVAVLLLTSATRQAQRRLAVCLTRGVGAELHVVREPYCGDGIAVVPKGTKAWDYERERGVTYQVNGIHTLCFEKAGATYLFDKGRFRRVVDSD